MIVSFLQGAHKVPDLKWIVDIMFYERYDFPSQLRNESEFLFKRMERYVREQTIFCIPEFADDFRVCLLEGELVINYLIYKCFKFAMKIPDFGRIMQNMKGRVECIMSGLLVSKECKLVYKTKEYLTKPMSVTIKEME